MESGEVEISLHTTENGYSSKAEVLFGTQTIKFTHFNIFLLFTLQFLNLEN